MQINQAQTKGSILIVDDEKIILDLTSIVLRNRGYTVLTAVDAKTGLAAVEANHPDLVLLDYMMPGFDGLSALKEIRKRFPDTSVIMFTGKGSEEIAVELMKAGASDYILKPFKNQDLADRIEHVLKVREVELRNKELLRERERLLGEIEAWNRELEARVKEKSDALQKVQNEIVQTEKLASLGYLAAGMAHEIRNPLNSISLFIQLIKSSMGNPENLGFIEKIEKEIDRIDGIMRKLLDASKRPRYEISDVRIDELISNTLEVFRPQIEINKIKLSVQFRQTPPAMKADPSEIEQIFTNLFLNAIHEMPGGGILGVDLDHDATDIIVRVSDTGRGMPKENVPKIFDPFFTTKGSGTGLGLAVVLRVVKSYHGKISVEKSDETGTTFRVSFPMP